MGCGCHLVIEYLPPYTRPLDWSSLKLKKKSLNCVENTLYLLLLWLPFISRIVLFMHSFIYSLKNHLFLTNTPKWSHRIVKTERRCNAAGDLSWQLKSSSRIQIKSLKHLLGHCTTNGEYGAFFKRNLRSIRNHIFTSTHIRAGAYCLGQQKFSITPSCSGEE